MRVAPSSSACASSRSSASVSLRLRRSPSTTTTTPPLASTSAASSVSTPPISVRGAQRARRGTPAESARRPDRRADTVSTTRPSRDALHRVGDGQRGHRAVGAVGDRLHDEIEQRARRERARRVVHDHDVDVVGNEREPGAHRIGARRAADRELHARRRGPVGVGGQHDDHAVARLLRDAHRPVDARSRRRARANCLAAPKRVPPPAATTIAQVRTPQVLRAGGSGCRDGRRAGGRRWSAPPT